MNERESNRDSAEQLDSEIKKTILHLILGSGIALKFSPMTKKYFILTQLPKKSRSQDVYISIWKQRKSRLQRNNACPVSAK